MIILDTTDKIMVFRARMNMIGIRTYLETDMRLTRSATNNAMLSIASETTGVDYLQGKSKATKKMLRVALTDLESIFCKN